MGKKKEAREAAELAAREAAIVAELAARKAAKKAKKKAKKSGTREPVVDPTPAQYSDIEKAVIADAKAARQKSAKAATADAAATVLADENASQGAKLSAELAAEAADEANHDETDEQIKARVRAKRAAREAELTQSVTSTPEALDAIAGDGTGDEVELTEAMAASGIMVGDGIVQRRKKGEKKATVAEVVAPGLDPDTVAKVDAAIEAIKHEVEQIETEQGREFVAGPVDVDPHNLAVPSDLPSKPDFEVNGNNQYKVKRPSDGKVVGYTRVTTYIANLEDRSMLEKWKLRMLLEGVAVNDAPTEGGRDIDPVVGKVRDLIHRRDVAIIKARKADKKGKLATGQLAFMVDGAWSQFKRDLNALAETLLDLGGANEASTKGTDIHALCELYDREGMDAIDELLTEGKITPADFDDVVAYADAMKRAGIKVLDIETPVVNDELKVAGRLDRTLLVRFPGMARAIRVVGDIKTGSIEWGPGKLAQQLDMYANAVGYDLETDERTDLKLSRTKAVVIHLPAGSGQCYIYPVDLVLGRKGNKLSGDVRAWRTEGKRAVDFKTDLADPVARAVAAADAPEEA